jgi:hypothetical protein
MTKKVTAAGDADLKKARPARISTSTGEPFFSLFLTIREKLLADAPDNLVK